MDNVDRMREPPRDTDVSQILGLFNSGSADVASEKDDYVDTAAITDSHARLNEPQS
jgi:hypothetical protein